MTIMVPKTFIGDFKEYCAWYGFNEDEINELRQCIRDDFDRFGPWVIRNAKIKRWMDAAWGKQPSLCDLELFMKKRPLFYDAHKNVFSLAGWFVILELCYVLENGET